MTALGVRNLARSCGFDLTGVAPAAPSLDFDYYQSWIARGLAGEMRYLTDHRATARGDPRNILPSARSVIVVGKLYNTPHPHSSAFTEEERAWISRYAWGDDYHEILRRDLNRLAAALGPGHEHRICVDTAPLLERSWARAAGLGWIGKNTCLINQQIGSWLFLGELLSSLKIAPDPAAQTAPDRCGTCRRCIDACPTQALTPYELDATRCISYHTIELRGPVPANFHAAISHHIFGCDICQEVCPWNRRAPVTVEPAFQPRHEVAPPLERMAALTEQEFREMFRGTPVTRARYAGFQRNVAIAMANR